MKRLLSVLLIATLLLSFAGCGEKESASSKHDDDTEEETATTTTSITTTSETTDTLDTPDVPELPEEEKPDNSESPDNTEQPTKKPSVVLTKNKDGEWKTSYTLGESTQDYYTDLLIEDVIADLCAQHGYSYTEAEQMVFFGGLYIYSYENVQLQHELESMFRNDSNFADTSGQLNAAVFIMDYNGRVVATVGNRGEKTGNRVTSYATDMRRNPGSAITPLSVYAPALERNLINYSTLVRDYPISPDFESLWPRNFGQNTIVDGGHCTVEKAIQYSYNTVPARILEKMGTDVGYNFLKQTLHFTSPETSDNAYPPLVVGDFSYGVTMREMVAGYQIFGNGGVYNKPYTYSLVKAADHSTTLLAHKPHREQAISPETAAIMNRLLQKATVKGPAAVISGDWYNTEIFAQAGTTENNKDAYFVGGTSQYVGAVWMGDSANQTTLTHEQRNQTKQLWSRCMLTVHDCTEKPGDRFDVWGDVTGRYYDSATGVIDDAGDAYGFYKTSNMPLTAPNSLSTSNTVH